MIELHWAADGSDAGVVAHVVAAMSRPGLLTLCLPGGETPRPIFATLAAMPLPWGKTTILPSDEREVPYSHPASNFSDLRAAFGTTGAAIEPLATTLLVPRFDLVWLGMGSDGHVASLFPNTDPDPKAPAAVIAVTPDPLPPEAPFNRLTLTLAALTNSRDIILVVRGRAKCARLESAARGDVDLPISRLLALAPITIFWNEG